MNAVRLRIADEESRDAVWSADRGIRIVSWNCGGDLAGKTRRLLALEPDVAIIQEAASRAEFPGLDRVAWAGWSESKGLAVFARPELDPALDPSWDPSRALYVPANLRAVDIDLLGVWAFDRRRAPKPSGPYMRETFDLYRPRFERGRSLVLGDFNDSGATFSRAFAQLGTFGCTSVYHIRSGEPQGAERTPTFFLYRKPERPWHIDYVFASTQLLEDIESFDVGRPDDWLSVSDHMPLIVVMQPGRIRGD